MRSTKYKKITPQKFLNHYVLLSAGVTKKNVSVPEEYKYTFLKYEWI